MRHRDAPAYTVRAMMVVVMRMVKIPRRAVEVLFDDDRRRGYVLDNHRARRHRNRCGGPQRRVLHGPDHFARDTLLTQKNDIAGLKWGGNAIRSDMIHNQVRRYTGARHLRNVARGDRPNRHLHVVGGHLLSNLRLVASLDVVQCVADQSAADGPGASANQGASARMAHGVANNRTDPGAPQASDQGPLIGIIGGPTARQRKRQAGASNEVGNTRTHTSHVLARKDAVEGSAQIIAGRSCRKRLDLRQERLAIRRVPGRPCARAVSAVFAALRENLTVRLLHPEMA